MKVIASLCSLVLVQGRQPVQYNNLAGDYSKPEFDDDFMGARAWVGDGFTDDLEAVFGCDKIQRYCEVVDSNSDVLQWCCASKSR